MFLRDGDTVYRTRHTNGRGTRQLTHTFALIDLLPYGRRSAPGSRAAASHPEARTSCHSPPFRLRLLPLAWPGAESPM